MPSFDQIGFVWAGGDNRAGVKINAGFNFHKSTNFSQILTAANYLNGASQTKWASAKTAYAKDLDKKYGKDAGDQVWSAVDANYNKLMGTSQPTTENPSSMVNTRRAISVYMIST